ncbi:Aspartyl glutamyl-tRNA amidotransferase subunit [Cordyceps militaris]|uniref:Altered inheritance of mitochondria protein 41 n=1 Tax=Cordyceps militaris TaxID=73501 RepID=A0A2H4SVD5_CORMI|nr:Aspartyl glutamyl-tRNA amidotransferase subunit [Cordyceps militaris]
MSSRIATMALRARLSPGTLRAAPRFLVQPTSRLSSSAADTPPPAPPLLQKLKGDLKTAMRAKDTDRLSVLRGILAAHLNASKTATPIKTDAQLVALLRKMAAGNAEAAAEARAAGRADLADKEAAQGAVLHEYVQGSGVATLGAAELGALVESTVAEVRTAGAEGKSLFGDVMKKLSAKLEGKDVDRKTLADLVKKLVSS